MHFAERWMQALWATRLRCIIIAVAFAVLAAWNMFFSGTFSVNRDNMLSLALCACVIAYAVYRAVKAER